MKKEEEYYIRCYVCRKIFKSNIEGKYGICHKCKETYTQVEIENILNKYTMLGKTLENNYVPKSLLILLNDRINNEINNIIRIQDNLFTKENLTNEEKYNLKATTDLIQELCWVRDNLDEIINWKISKYE